MRSLNVGFFTIYLGGLATLISIWAVTLWQGRVKVFDSSFTLPNLEARPSDSLSFIKSMAASAPSAAFAVWSLLLGTLAIHYSEISENHILKNILLAIGWLVGTFAMIFFALGLTTTFLGRPKFLIPPPLRELK